MCCHCHTMIKMTTGMRTCTYYCDSKGYTIGADTTNKVMGIWDTSNQHLATISYIRGLDSHPNPDRDSTIGDLEQAIPLTHTPAPPDDETLTEGATDTEYSGHADSDNTNDRPDSPRRPCQRSET